VSLSNLLSIKYFDHLRTLCPKKECAFIGSHTLRHSTATVMMNEGIPITTISNVLGHTTTENTKYYLNIDIKSLLECSGNVIEVPSDFYEQNGGMFYE